MRFKSKEIAGDCKVGVRKEEARRSAGCIGDLIESGVCTNIYGVSAPAPRSPVGFLQGWGRSGKKFI